MPDGGIDFHGLAESIERLLAMGFDGLLIGGTYGEFATMSAEERAALFRHVVEVVRGRAPTLLCSAHSDPRVALELTQLATGLGGVPMVTPPFVSEVDDEHILGFFKSLAAASSSGLVIYNAPGIGITLSAGLIERLSDMEHIIGLKQGDLSPTVIDQLSNRLGGKIRLFCASDLAFLGPMMAGFDGLSSTNSCAMPEVIRESYRAIEAGDARTANAAAQELVCISRTGAAIRPTADGEGRHESARLVRRGCPCAVAIAYASSAPRAGRSRGFNSGGRQTGSGNAARRPCLVRARPGRNGEMSNVAMMVPQGAETVFPKEEYARRVARLREQMAAKGFDLFLTSGPENIFYLSGQQTPGYYTFQCLCIPQSGEPFHILRGLEAMNARLNTLLTDIEGYADDAHPAAALAASLKRRGWLGKRVAIDRNSWFLTVNIYERLVAEFGSLLDGSGLVEPLRRVKSRLEIEQMEKSATANDAGMQSGLDAVRAGVSENDVAAAIMNAAIKAGSEYLGMDPFVTSGPRSGVPHTTWRRRTIESGDLVALETCACYNRYHTAMFRTVGVGRIPQLALDMYKTCEEGLAAAIENLRPGRTCADVHRSRRLHRRISQAYRLQCRHLVRARLG
jgi:Xaa-Pro dipeptidase